MDITALHKAHPHIIWELHDSPNPGMYDLTASIPGHAVAASILADRPISGESITVTRMLQVLKQRSKPRRIT